MTRFRIDKYGWCADERALDADEEYRYLLRRVREGGDGSHLMVVGLNPSEAGTREDPHKVDTTVLVVEQWASLLDQFSSLARSESYSTISFVNLFAWRSSDQAELDRRLAVDSTVDAVGVRNSDVIRAVADETPETIVCAWGDAKEVTHRDRFKSQRNVVLDVLAPYATHHVGTLTGKREPRHGMTWRFTRDCDGILRTWALKERDFGQSQEPFDA